MTTFHTGIAEVVRRDPRYVYEAYEFVFEALTYTLKRLQRLPRPKPGEEPGPQHHVGGRELLDGIRDYALVQFGLMARTVFRLWGINRTDDFGEIVFNLVEANLMSKTDQDSRADFHDIFNLDEALTQGFEIRLEEAE
jgi:uncharacterized repeat protein (TIGR04138 family)